jgi:predicted transcriptional regulator
MRDSLPPSIKFSYVKSMIAISLRSWFWAVPVYALLHLIHVLSWRIRRPANDVVSLFLLFIALPFVGFVILIAWGAEALPLFPILMFVWILSANYIAVYPAVQASSPTLDILHLLRQHPEGLTETELTSKAGSASLFQDRLSDLVRGGLMKPTHNGFELTVKGNLLATFFVNYRRLIGLPRGAG